MSSTPARLSVLPLLSLGLLLLVSFGEKLYHADAEKRIAGLVLAGGLLGWHLVAWRRRRELERRRLSRTAGKAAGESDTEGSWFDAALVKPHWSEGVLLALIVVQLVRQQFSGYELLWCSLMGAALAWRWLDYWRLSRQVPQDAGPRGEESGLQ